MKYALLLLLIHISLDVAWSASVGQCDESKCTSSWIEVIDAVAGTELVGEYPCQVPNGLAGCTCEPGYRALVLNTVLEYPRYVSGVVQYICCQTGEDEAAIQESVYCGDYRPLDIDTNPSSSDCTRDHCKNSMMTSLDLCLTRAGETYSCTEGYYPELTGRSSPLLIHQKYTMVYEYYCCPDNFSSDNNVALLSPPLCSTEICKQAEVCFEELGCFVPDNPGEYQGCVSNKCSGYNPGNSFRQGCYTRQGRGTCACEDGLLPKSTGRKMNDGLFEYVCCPAGTPGAAINCQSDSSSSFLFLFVVFDVIALFLYSCLLCWDKGHCMIWNKNKTTIANGNRGENEHSLQPDNQELLHSGSLRSEASAMEQGNAIESKTREERGQQKQLQGREDTVVSSHSPPFELRYDANVPKQELLQSMQFEKTKTTNGSALENVANLETHQQHQDLSQISKTERRALEHTTPITPDLQMVQQKQDHFMQELLILKQQMQFLIENHNAFCRTSPPPNDIRSKEAIGDVTTEKAANSTNSSDFVDHNNTPTAKFHHEVIKKQTIIDESKETLVIKKLSYEIDDIDEVQTTYSLGHLSARTEFKATSTETQNAAEIPDEGIEANISKDENTEPGGKLDCFATDSGGLRTILSETKMADNDSNSNESHSVARLQGDEGKRRESVNRGVIQNVIYGNIGEEDSDELGGIHQWFLYHLTKKPASNSKVWAAYSRVILSAFASWVFLLGQLLILYFIILETAAPKCQISDCREGTTCDQDMQICVDIYFYQSCPYLEKLSPLPLGSIVTVGFILIYIIHSVVRDLEQNFRLCKAARHRYSTTKGGRHYIMNWFVAFNIWSTYFIRGYLLPSLIFGASMTVFYAEDDGFTVTKIVLNGIAIVFLVEFDNIVHDLLLTPRTQNKVNAEMQCAYKQEAYLSTRGKHQQLAGRRDREVYMWWIHRIMSTCMAIISLIIVNDPIQLSIYFFNNGNCDAIFVLAVSIFITGVCFSALDNFVRDSLSWKAAFLNFFFTQVLLTIVYFGILTPLAVVTYLGKGGMKWYLNGAINLVKI